MGNTLPENEHLSKGTHDGRSTRLFWCNCQEGCRARYVFYMDASLEVDPDTPTEVIKDQFELCLTQTIQAHLRELGEDEAMIQEIGSISEEATIAISAITAALISSIKADITIKSVELPSDLDDIFPSGSPFQSGDEILH